jgi:uncharacterized damage-inducible protein DinB
MLAGRCARGAFIDIGGNMDLQTIKILAEYNKTTNNKMNAYIKALSDSQWNKTFGGFYNSIKSLCNHIYISDYNWLKRFSTLKNYNYIKSGFSNDIQFGTIFIESIEVYCKLRTELDNSISGFVNEVDKEELKTALEYKDSHGTVYKRNYGGLILHMFNHQTHHRGMISIYLEEMGIANDYSNLSNIL